MVSNSCGQITYQQQTPIFKLAASVSDDPRKTKAPEVFDLPRPYVWLRGLDLNQRPLGYEPFPNHRQDRQAPNNRS